MIVATDPRERERLVDSYLDQHDVVLASVPLEVIGRLETDGARISMVVVSDVAGSVGRGELVEFLTETYPFVRVVVADRPVRDVAPIDLAAILA